MEPVPTQSPSPLPHREELIGIPNLRTSHAEAVARASDRYCLRERSLELFFQEVRKQIANDRRCGIDGQTYENYLGSWVVTVKYHVRRTCPEIRCGRIEVISVYDEKSERQLPELVQKLNEFCVKK